MRMSESENDRVLRKRGGDRIPGHFPHAGSGRVDFGRKFGFGTAATVSLAAATAHFELEPQLPFENLARLPANEHRGRVDGF